MQQAPAKKNKIDEIAKGLYSEAEQRNQSKLKRKDRWTQPNGTSYGRNVCGGALWYVINRVQDAATPDHLLYGNLGRTRCCSWRRQMNLY